MKDKTITVNENQYRVTNSLILKKVIEKAEAGGFKHSYEGTLLYNLIFSHDFAKAFFKLDDTNFGQGSWEENLQKMVLEREPLKYLEKFLK